MGFLKLMQSNDYSICEQAIWGIGNLSADSVKVRDIVLSYGTMGMLIKRISDVFVKRLYVAECTAFCC